MYGVHFPYKQDDYWTYFLRSCSRSLNNAWSLENTRCTFIVSCKWLHPRIWREFSKHLFRIPDLTKIRSRSKIQWAQASRVICCAQVLRQMEVFPTSAGTCPPKWPSCKHTCENSLRSVWSACQGSLGSLRPAEWLTDFAFPPRHVVKDRELMWMLACCKKDPECNCKCLSHFWEANSVPFAQIAWPKKHSAFNSQVFLIYCPKNGLTPLKSQNKWW
jgi:hypothetical protein